MQMGDLGNWSLTAAYNYNKTRIERRLNELGPLASIPGIVLFGRVEGLRFTEGQPRDKIVLSADGDIGILGITARTTRYGRVVSPGAANPANATSLTDFGPDDIFLRREVDHRPRAAGERRGAGRVRDRREQSVRRLSRPLSLRTRPASVGGVFPANQQYIPFSIFSPFGFNGRYVYGRMSVQF
jgi:iron complex outermembrane receptor protein